MKNADQPIPVMIARPEDGFAAGRTYPAWIREHAVDVANESGEILRFPRSFVRFDVRAWRDDVLDIDGVTEALDNLDERIAEVKGKRVQESLVAASLIVRETIQRGGSK